MGIQADQKDFKQAFQKHLHTYSNWDNTGSDISKRLVLIYCVECGLKYKLMQEKRIYRVQDAQQDLQDDLNSHDFQKLIKRLNYLGSYSFPQIETVHGDKVIPVTYHQLCRYAISPIKAHENYIQKYDEQLADIASWLKEKV